MERQKPHFLNEGLNEAYLPLEEKKGDQSKTQWDLLQEWAVADIAMRQIWSDQEWS